MGDLTTKLSLYLPGGGSSGLILPDEIIDIDRINDNMRKIDDVSGAKIVTSTTRPALPFDGQTIYETDTRLVAIYRAVGANWIYPNSISQVADAAARDARYPTPVAGTIVYNLALRGFQYYDAVTARWRRTNTVLSETYFPTVPTWNNTIQAAIVATDIPNITANIVADGVTPIKVTVTVVFMNLNSGAARTGAALLVIDGVAVVTYGGINVSFVTTADKGTATFQYVSVPAAGARVYKVQSQAGAAASISVAGCHMLIEETA